MANILQRMKRLAQSIISFGLNEREDSTAAGSRELADMKMKLAELRASAARVIAGQYRIERALNAEQEKLSGLDAEIGQSKSSGCKEVIDDLQLRRDACKSRVDEVNAQLETARAHSSEARREMEQFHEGLRAAENRARDAQMYYQLATLRAQVQKLALDASLGVDLAAIEKMERRADSADAEAAALEELNAALGHKCPGDSGEQTP